MKTLLQLTQEELDAFVKNVTMQSVGMPNEIQIAEKTKAATDVYQAVQKRLDADPALNYLAAITTNVLMGLLSMAPDAFSRTATTKLVFAKMVEVWENANTKFSQQLEPKP